MPKKLVVYNKDKDPSLCQVCPRCGEKYPKGTLGRPTYPVINGNKLKAFIVYICERCYKLEKLKE